MPSPCSSCVSCFDAWKTLFVQKAEPEYNLLFVAPADDNDMPGLSREHVTIEFSNSFARKRHKNNSRIDEVWSSKLQANPRMFSGPKFRLAGCRWEKSSSGQGRLFFQLSLTEYKDLVGTNMLPQEEFGALQAAGEKDWADPWAYFSNALGCDVLLETSDGHFMFLERSSACADYPSHYQGPSGHPEPHHIEGLGLTSKLEAASELQSCLSRISALKTADFDEYIADELFASALDETKEELVIPEETLSRPRLLGVMTDLRGKPDALFYIKTSLTSSKVREAYMAAKHTGQGETWESNCIVSPGSLSEARALPLTPCAAANIACFERVSRGRRR